MRKSCLTVDSDQGTRPVLVAPPAFCHAWKPPKRAETLDTPLFCRMSAAPALDSSAGHVQYVMIGFPLGIVSNCVSMLANGMLIAPAMWPRW